MSKNLMTGKAIAVITLILVLFGVGLILLTGKGSHNLLGKVTTKTVAVNNVILTSEGFSPSTITINPGEVVLWTNQSGKTASINSDDHPTHKLYPELNIGVVANGSTAQAMLTKTGTYTYHNHLNPQEKGTIIVK